MRLHFMGGADMVTGSQHVIEANGLRVLRDCGLFQGRRAESSEMNRHFNFDVGSIDASVLSHAHIDHCGNYPSLVKQGYSGKIYATHATVELCQIMLKDAAFIQEQDAAYLNQKSNRKGLPAVSPIYTVLDAERALELFEGVRYDWPVELAPGWSVSFHEAGHILGAAVTVFDVEEDGRRTRVAYAVDLGRHSLPLIRDPEIVSKIDVLVLESTYGNRLHGKAQQAEDQLAEVINETIARNGKVLIPSFALERAQEILYHISSLVNKGTIPQVPVYVDSPMATAVTKVFQKRWEYMDADFFALRGKLDHIMSPSWVHFVSSVNESREITKKKEPCIVISASGMCEHGRILHHLKSGVGDEANSIVIVGYQAEYTLGRRIVEGDKILKIFGDDFPLHAKVHVLDAFSAHADRNELIAYARAVRPKAVFLVHGEEEPRISLAEALRNEQFCDVYTPMRGDSFDLKDVLK